MPSADAPSTPSANSGMTILEPSPERSTAARRLAFTMRHSQMSESDDVMLIRRRQFMLATGGALACGLAGTATLDSQERPKMYGLIAKMNSTPSQRDALIAILLSGSVSMPGCLSYVVAKDPDDDSGIWITEVWENESSHTASLTLASRKDDHSSRDSDRGTSRHRQTVRTWALDSAEKATGFGISNAASRIGSSAIIFHRLSRARDQPTSS